MKFCSTRSLRLLSPLLAATAWGCVTQGTFDEVSAERDRLREMNLQLEERLTKLGASTASLQAERLELIDEMEDLRQAREAVERDIQRLRRSEADLTENLAAREAELASTQESLAKLQGTYEDLVTDLEDEVAAGQIEIEQLREGLRLNLTQEVLFPSGSSKLNEGGIQVLRKVAQRLKSLPNDIEVQGHTDNVALRPSASYPSNWELAAARAARVVRLFVDSGVSPERLTVVSFGEHAPIASNETPAGRAKNRRIEIRLQPAKQAAPADAEPPNPS